MAVLFRHELLAKVRVELGLTQEDAARSVGVDVRTYRRYESGEVNEAGVFAVQRASRRRILERICRELGIEESELLVPVDPRPMPPVVLPRARHFVGREPELARLGAWLGDAGARVRIVAVVAMGGAGKTSLVERALAEHGREPRVLVHSFYDEPSVDAMLASLAAHFGEAAAEPLDGVLAGLARAPASVLVLDGLELAQADGEGERARGQLEDRRLLRLFRAIAGSARVGRALVTSRFALSDLAAHEGAELETLALQPFDPAETRLLLEQWGARGSGESFKAVHEHTGGHALSLAVIGSYASELLGQDLELATRLDLADAAREQPLARRLRRVLDKYAAELQPVERRLLVGVCLFPRGASEATLAELPDLGASSAIGLRAALGRLVRRGLVALVGERYSAHPFIREHFASDADAAVIHQQQRERLAAELAEKPLHRPTGTALLDRCERLFEHTLLGGDVAGAYRVLERTLGGFAHLGLRLGEFERGLRLVRALEPGAAGLPGDVQWRIGYERGLYAAALGDLEAAVSAYRKLLARRDDDATTHRTLAYTLRLQGALPQALEEVDYSLALGRRDEAVGTLARGLALRGAILTNQGQLQQAGEAFDEARALGDTPTARRAIWEAEYRLASGDPERAAVETAQNLAWCQQRGWAGHVAHCHVVLGRAALARGLIGDAEEALAAAEDWCLRSREMELTLEAKLLEHALAGALGERARAESLRSQLREAAGSGGFGLVLQAIDYGRG